MSNYFFFAFLFFSLSPLSHSQKNVAYPDPETVQTFLPAQSPPATIPAFPEQSAASACPLNLSDELFRGVKVACASDPKHMGSDQLHRSRCCPVLAAWLYSAYSKTALEMAPTRTPMTSSYDLPLLPDDSETCVDTLEKALENRGIELVRPNETCDVVYCYCGIRLHPLSCPEAFSYSSEGKLVGHESVKRLEKECFSNGNAGLAGCSNCLHTLLLLNENKSGNRSISKDRTSKMHDRDCELMGLTWLLAKNRSAYIHTVSAVLRAMMMSAYSSNPQSCSLNSDGMPLAVDSSQINDQSSIPLPRLSFYLFITSLSLLYTGLII